MRPSRFSWWKFDRYHLDYDINEITSINVDQWETLSKIINYYVECSIEICASFTERVSQEIGSRVVEESSSIEACLSIMHRACAIMTLTLEEKLSAEWRF